jgi:hypothetical protein
MTLNLRWTLALLVAACLPFAACKKMEVAEEELESPAHVEHPNGEDAPATITLGKEAAERLDLHTATIEEADANGAKQKIMPYAALLYDKDGETWAYVNPEAETYMREKLKIDRIEGEKVFLAEGPKAGTKVVTTGAAELYGSEEEFEEE